MTLLEFYIYFRNQIFFANMNNDKKVAGKIEIFVPKLIFKLIKENNSLQIDHNYIYSP